MAEFLGIRNENEFYFAHYLSSLMDDELKEMCQNEALAKACDNILSLGKDYYEVRRLRERAEQSKSNYVEFGKEYLKLRKVFVEKLVGILGYADVYKPQSLYFKGQNIGLPISGCVLDATGKAPVVLIDSCRTFTSGARKTDVSILQNYPTPEQLKCDGLTVSDIDMLSSSSVLRKNQKSVWENLLTNEIFTSESQPRFVIVFAENAILLADSTKWAERRSMIFLLDDIFEQLDRATCRAMVCLLHRNSLAPDSGTQNLPDKLDANSHKNAFGVSKSLRYAMRDAIELLGNAIITNKPNDVEIEASSLSKECIIIMYRFLFVLFLESRKDLQYFKRSENNAANDIFWSAYGLDHLRDLETVPLLTETAKNGHYFDESIKQLFLKIWSGTEVTEKENPVASLEGFRLMPLKAHLFDPNRTPLFNASNIPNVVWQKIVYSLSIGETGTGKYKRKGRISYAQLGIQQLGSVYEALLSYTGFYAKEDLYEVRNAGVKESDSEENLDDGSDSKINDNKTNSSDVFDTGYFITESELKNYKESEIVSNDGHRVCHKKGTFIYRMAGRDRERSASYYTPNELTRSLVRLAIKERVTDDMPADEVMKLMVCEPAMGSAAFLNEVIDQLADIYLRKKQKELKKTIPIEQYAAEKARVKMVIGDNNVFGVDLNPTAADLAEVSLWLGSIGGEHLPTGQDRAEPYIPWFGTQLKCGNSIVGCRREVVFRDGTRKKLSFNESFPENAVWHFLIPEKGMAVNLDKVVKGIVGDRVYKQQEKWAKVFQLPDKKKANNEYDKVWKRLQYLSKQIDKLWKNAAKDIDDLNSRTRDDVAYFGYKPKSQTYQDIETKDIQLNAEISRDEYGNIDYSKSLGSVSEYFRLKTILDLWCSLWFWPLDQIETLPSFESFEAFVRVLSRSEFNEADQLEFDFVEDFRKTIAGASLEKEFNSNPSLGNLYKLFPFAKVSQSIAEHLHFFHWELEFAPIFQKRGGFDLIVGNPPWVKVQWEEAGILSEYDPHIAVRKISANDTMALRKNVFSNYRESKNSYLNEYVVTNGTKSFIGPCINYPTLVGCQSNLYKNFIPLAFRLVNDAGVTAFIHPEGVYDDPKGGKLRELIYPRLRLHAQFRNTLGLFDIDGRNLYGLNVYAQEMEHVSFKSISTLFHPSTLEDSLCISNSDSDLPLERTKDGKWNLTGHPDRVVHVNDDTLKLFASLYDEPGTSPRAARLPALYTSQFISPILERFQKAEKKIQDIEYGASEGWHETMSQKDGTIRRQTGFVAESDEVIYSGPQFFVGTPVNKTPRLNCKSNGDYDNVDLTEMCENYRPRTNYIRNVDKAEYIRRMPTICGEKVADCWRVFSRKMINGSNERSLIPCFAPKGWVHVHSVISFGNNGMDMNEFTSIFGAWFSVPFDWFVRMTGKQNLNDDTVRMLPVIKKNSLVSSRALLLNCVNFDYAELWNKAWDEAFRNDGWLSSDRCLTKWDDHFAEGNEWRWGTPLRTQLDRRQALVELDVIVAKALGLSLDDLLLMYRVSFTVLRKYESETFYDQNGRCVFSAKNGESYFSRKEWEAIRDMKEGEFEKRITETVFSDTPTARTIVYKAPFFSKDREADYREAWEELEKREKLS